LLATVPAARVEGALSSLEDAGYDAALVGRVEEGAGVEDEVGRPLPNAARDEVARLLSTGDERGGDATI
jgi:hydrogenase maturation factor